MFGVYVGKELHASWRVSTDTLKMPDEHAVLLESLFAQQGLRLADITAVVLASVVPPLTTTFEEFSQRYLALDPVVVGPGVRTGVRILYEDPRGALIESPTPWQRITCTVGQQWSLTSAPPPPLTLSPRRETTLVMPSPRG